jgi:pimeloyl-ACP methyl ester carboxylesterase
MTDRPHDAIPDLPVPRRAERWREVMMVREPWRLMARAGAVARQPRGGGRPVMVIPGFSANDASTIPLRSYLSGLGYECRGWGLGVNSGDLQTQVPQTIERIGDWYRERSEPISLVGWSLGGVVARETTRTRPDLVARVITFGTPLWGPRHTTTSTAQSAQLDDYERRILARNRQRILRPVTAIYSRNDGIVHWRACVDPDPDTVNIEVTSSHIGLGIDPDVWCIVASTLGASGASSIDGADHQTGS